MRLKTIYLNNNIKTNTIKKSMFNFFKYNFFGSSKIYIAVYFSFFDIYAQKNVTFFLAKSELLDLSIKNDRLSFIRDVSYGFLLENIINFRYDVKNSVNKKLLIYYNFKGKNGSLNNIILPPFCFFFSEVKKLNKHFDIKVSMCYIESFIKHTKTIFIFIWSLAYSVYRRNQLLNTQESLVI